MYKFKEKRRIQIRLLIVISLSFIVYLCDAGYIKDIENYSEVYRNKAGEGKKKDRYTIRRRGEKEKVVVNLDIEEKSLTKKEARQELRNVVKRLDKIILDKNKSFKHVDKDLKFPSSLTSSPAKIYWKIEPGNLIRYDGRIRYERVLDNGSLVTVKATIFCRGEEAYYEKQMVLYPPQKPGILGDALEVKRQFKNAEENTREKESIKLPNKINGKEIIWEKERKNRGPWIFVLGCVLAIMPQVRYKEKIGKETKIKMEKNKEDYPDIVSKLALLVGAGMTIRNAFIKIAVDYRRKGGEKRPAYEEMIIAKREMESGQSEAGIYESFGRRMALPTYVKLGQILSQQVRRGGGGLKKTLEMEAVYALEEKKRNARKKGEEISSKLLIPMFLMMGIVFAIVMVPAFYSMHIN